MFSVSTKPHEDTKFVYFNVNVVNMAHGKCE